MRRFLLLAGVTALLPASLGAQAPTGAFLTRLGRDTVAFERYTRAKDRLEGDLVVTTPRTRLIHYAVSFRADGSASKAELSNRPAVEGPGAQPALNLTAEFMPEAILVRRPDRVDTVKVAAGGTQAVVPNLFYSWAMAELATGHAARQGGDSVPLFQFGLTGRQPTPTSVVRRGRDSVALDFFGSPMMFRVDRSGKVLGVNGGRTTVKVLAERLADVDLAKLTESFAARERSGQVVGQLSPRDTVRASVAGSDLLVDYGRPSKRGRQILGTVVPWNEVWRTGANAATQFTTSKDLQIGGTAVPAGTYTLWSLPASGGTKLIINKQTKQWGTEYHPEQDLLRVDVKTEKLDQEVEKFTISIVPEGNGGAGTLRFDWDRTRWAVPFTVK